MNLPTIDRKAWISCSERLPEHQTICLITDGREIGLAEYDAKMPGGWWDGVGCSGSDFEWNFTPTHWMPLSVELPDVTVIESAKDG